MKQQLTECHFFRIFSLTKSVILFLMLSAVLGCVKKGTDSSPKPPIQSVNPTVYTKPEPVNLTPETVDKFVDWASSSGLDEQEKVRNAIKESSGNEKVLNELITRFEKVDTTDLSYSLVVLSLIGEMQNPASMPWLEKQVYRPIPPNLSSPHGGLNSTDIVEMVATKAVECLAYLKNEKSDRLTLRVIAKHSSATVRSAAIDAYLYNHNDSEEAKRQLMEVIQKGDLLLLDRARFTRAKDSKAFNATVERFNKLHPEQLAQSPGEPTEKGPKYDTTKIGTINEPPKLIRK